MTLCTDWNQGLEFVYSRDETAKDSKMTQLHACVIAQSKKWNTIQQIERQSESGKFTAILYF